MFGPGTWRLDQKRHTNYTPLCKNEVRLVRERRNFSLFYGCCRDPSACCSVCIKQSYIMFSTAYTVTPTAMFPNTPLHASAPATMRPSAIRFAHPPLPNPQGLLSSMENCQNQTNKNLSHSYNTVTYKIYGNACAYIIFDS